MALSSSIPMFDPAEHPHRRRNALTGRWVLVSPHRAARPWQGLDEPGEASGAGMAHDPDCHLCPGNMRGNGLRNPDYAGPYVFPNDFPALLPDTPAPDGGDRLFAMAPARGTARVICHGPDHSRRLAQMTHGELRALVDCWAGQTAELAETHAHVQLFENRGAMMGCSSPHPHGQVWASDFIPSEVLDEDREQAAWWRLHARVLLDDVVKAELAAGERIVALEPHWLAVVPWWATWPFEILLIAREDVARLDHLGDEARHSLARILRDITARYDGLFGVPMPYSMGWHQLPATSAAAQGWRLHAHFYPPLLRSAQVRKFMVGFEMLAEAQRDLTPEAAAARLRASG